MYDDIIKLLEFEDIQDKILKLETTSVNRNLIVDITLKPLTSNCINCESNLIVVKEYRMNKIIHSVSITRNIIINYRKRRYFCKVCKKTFSENDPFTDNKHKISKLTIMNVLDYLKDVNHSFSGAAKYFNLSIQTVINIFDHYIEPIALPLPKVLCIDEVHIKSRTKYPYACVLLDFNKNKIINILKTRQKDYLRRYFQMYTVKELDMVEYVVMDLWAPYKDVVKEFMPKAKIVADAFHVVVNINKVLDKKRIQVMNSYIHNKTLDLNFSNDYGYLLKRFSWLLKLNPKNIKGFNIYVHKYKFSIYNFDLINHLLDSNRELKEIYKLKNIYEDFNSKSDTSSAKIKLLELINNFRNHEIAEIREYGRLLYRWQNEIINSFNTYNGIRYSNGKLESRNRQIKTILRNAFGFKNFNRFRARVMYSINKDIALKINKK